MIMSIAEELIIIVRGAAGAEVCQAVDASRAEGEAMVASMTAVEYADWILSEE